MNPLLQKYKAANPDEQERLFIAVLRSALASDATFREPLNQEPTDKQAWQAFERLKSLKRSEDPKDHQRFGQWFCNKYDCKCTKLFYEENSGAALAIVKELGLIPEEMY